MTNRLKYSTGSTFEKEAAYSRVVKVGDTIYVSGTTGYDYSKMTISADVVVQAEQCLKNIEEALKEVGASLSDIVKITYILPNRDDFKKCWPVLRKYLSDVNPAATMFEARLLNDEMKIEIEVVAEMS